MHAVLPAMTLHFSDFQSQLYSKVAKLALKKLMQRSSRFSRIFVFKLFHVGDVIFWVTFALCRIFETRRAQASGNIFLVRSGNLSSNA